MVASQETHSSLCPPKTWRSVVIIALAAFLIAASGRGVFDTQEDPRAWSKSQITRFVVGTVNASLFTKQWQPGDTVTICQAGSSRCILVAYLNIMSHEAWAKARDVDSREKPPDVSLWDRFINWLFGRGGVPSTTTLEALIGDWSTVPAGSVTIGTLRPDDTLTKCTGCHGSDWQQVVRRPAWEPLRGFAREDWIALIRNATTSTDDAQYGWSEDALQTVRMLNGGAT